MKVVNRKLSGIPDDYRLLFLGSIHNNQLFFVVIVKKDLWDEKSCVITGAEIAAGMNGQKLKFIPVSSFVVQGENKERIEIIADEGHIKIKSSYENIILTGEVDVPIQLIYYVFERTHLK